MDSLNNSNHGGVSSLHNLKPIFFIILTIFLITLLISISICFLLRCLNRHRHRRFLSSAASVVVESRQYSFSVHRVSPETVTSPILDSLPLFKFSSVTRRSSPVTSGDCAVCLSKFESQDNLRLLPLCCHAFHADCIDKWLLSNQSCPLCRSPLFVSESDLINKTLTTTTTNNTLISDGAGENSFRLEIGSISRRQNLPESGDQNRSYSIGSFNYILDEESEISSSNFHRISSSSKDEDVIAAIEASLAAEIGGGSRNWLDRISRSISSRAFRGSGRIFTGSDRWNDELTADVEANRAGEEISEFFRWFSPA